MSGGVGIVVIGRNEGERLRRCLESVCGRGLPVVYADSASTDGSPALARSMGAECVEIDPATPLSAARGRNAGLRRLLELRPDLEYVQFVDGDCELADAWIDRAVREMVARPDVAVVCGDLAEKWPEASIYNRLCALEWQKPDGEIKASGGIFLGRVKPLLDAGGFRDDVPAAEEDELCLRLRRGGWKIVKIGAPMARHDAAMTSFRQWWRRARRAGYAFAQGAALHGASPERHFVRDCARVVVWGAAVPLLAMAPAWWTGGWSLLLLLAYPLMCAKVYLAGRRRGWSPADARLYALFTVLAKIPAMAGFAGYWIRRLRAGRPEVASRGGGL